MQVKNWWRHAAALLLTLATCGAAQAQQTVEVIVFPGGFNWPIWVAQERGLFAANGLTVKLTPTPNSVFQLTGLIDGKFDIAMTAIDNLIAYREGQGEAKVDGPDLTSPPSWAPTTAFCVWWQCRK